MSGRECPDGIVDLVGGGKAEIVLSKGAAELRGSIVDPNSKPAAGAMVTMIPEDKIKQRRTDLFRFATSDQNGHFEIDDVAPGTYQIFAWEELEAGAAEDPEFLRLFESKSTLLTLDDGAREAVSLKAISIQDVITAAGSHP